MEVGKSMNFWGREIEVRGYEGGEGMEGEVMGFS